MYLCHGCVSSRYGFVSFLCPGLLLIPSLLYQLAVAAHLSFLLSAPSPTSFPSHRLFCIVGIVVAAQLETWHLLV